VTNGNSTGTNEEELTRAVKFALLTTVLDSTFIAQLCSEYLRNPDRNMSLIISTETGSTIGVTIFAGAQFPITTDTKLLGQLLKKTPGSGENKKSSD
jgi:hypothetical protein